MLLLAPSGEPWLPQQQQQHALKAANKVKKDNINLNKNFWVFTGSSVGVVPIKGKGLYTGKIDKLRGLKENVVIGRLIPAGTGYGASQGQADLVSDIESELSEIIADTEEADQSEPSSEE